MHQIFDNRINKEINTLIKQGYELYYIAPADQKEIDKYISYNKNVNVIPIKKYKNRKKRMKKGAKEAYEAALKVDADVYHFHDPELIIAGIKLKLRGKKVIYDVHENYISVFLSRGKNSRFLKYILVVFYWFFERISDLLFDGIITVNEEVNSKFRRKKSIIIPNYPELSFFENEDASDKKTPNGDERVIFLYLGGISVERGIKEMLKAAEIASRECRMKLVMIGRPDDEESKKYLTMKQDYFEYIPQKPYFEALSLARKADVGMITLHPTPNHLSSSPNKLFEYMALGLPVIASDFPKWHEYLDEADCAFFVDPKNPESIGKKMIKLCKDAALRKEMGARAKKMANERYSWASIEQNIIDMYTKILY